MYTNISDAGCICIFVVIYLRAYLCSLTVVTVAYIALACAVGITYYIVVAPTLTDMFGHRNPTTRPQQNQAQAGPPLAMAGAPMPPDPWDNEQGNRITRSRHAEIRSSEGRNVNTAINDVKRARPADVMLQDDGRWVVRGKNGRAHVFEIDGEHVTTMDNITNANTNFRIAKGKWQPLTLEQEQIFRESFSNYVNW